MPDETAIQRTQRELNDLLLRQKTEITVLRIILQYALLTLVSPAEVRGVVATMRQHVAETLPAAIAGTAPEKTLLLRQTAREQADRFFDEIEQVLSSPNPSSH